MTLGLTQSDYFNAGAPQAQPDPMAVLQQWYTAYGADDPRFKQAAARLGVDPTQAAAQFTSNIDQYNSGGLNKDAVSFLKDAAGVAGLAAGGLALGGGFGAAAGAANAGAATGAGGASSLLPGAGVLAPTAGVPATVGQAALAGAGLPAGLGGASTTAAGGALASGAGTAGGGGASHFLKLGNQLRGLIPRQQQPQQNQLASQLQFSKDPSRSLLVQQLLARALRHG